MPRLQMALMLVVVPVEGEAPLIRLLVDLTDGGPRLLVHESPSPETPGL